MKTKSNNEVSIKLGNSVAHNNMLMCISDRMIYLISYRNLYLKTFTPIMVA